MVKSPSLRREEKESEIVQSHICEEKGAKVSSSQRGPSKYRNMQKSRPARKKVIKSQGGRKFSKQLEIEQTRTLEQIGDKISVLKTISNQADKD